jgi:hypothetical protein
MNFNEFLDLNEAMNIRGVFLVPLWIGLNHNGWIKGLTNSFPSLL